MLGETIPAVRICDTVTAMLQAADKTAESSVSHLGDVYALHAVTWSVSCEV